MTDDGPGVDEVDQEHVFDRFWHATDSSGSGLGLPIAAQIARAHGGEATLTSPVDGGRGCRVALTLRAGGR